MYSFGSPRHVWRDASLDVTIQPGPATSPGTAGTEGADQRSEAGDRASQAPPPLRIEGPALASIFFLDPVPPKTF
jgi:hypothetical protein